MAAYPARALPVRGPAPERLLWSVEAAAEVMTLSRAKVCELIASGELPSIKIGTARRIPVECVREFIARKLGDGQA